MPANMAAGALRINKSIFTPIANYPKFILNQFKEVGQSYAEKTLVKNVTYYRFLL